MFMPVARHTHTTHHDTSTPDQKGPKKQRHIPWKKVFLACLITGVIGFALLTLYVAWISRDLPDPNNLNNRHVAESTKIYDRTGEHLLYEIYLDRKRTIVELPDLPQHLINATVSVEDAKFFEHSGIRITSIIRAGISGIFHLKTGRGGASTLTQQFVKNAIVGDERGGLSGINRKIKEAILSMQLERKYSKQEILKLYFNEVPYGSTNYGIESAAQSYFGKSSKDLNLAESATLAGIVQRPSVFLNNHDLLKNRRDFVLRRMKEEGYITEDVMKATQTEPLNLRNRLTGIEAPHYVLYVKELLERQFGEKLVETGGLRVITALDYDKNKIAQEEIAKFLKDNGERYNAGNAALVSIDPKTGQVLTMVGSKDYFGKSEPEGCTPGKNCVFEPNTNVALRPRQPGSSFKPFVYTAGFEKGYTPETLLYDTITNFDPRPGQSYIPKNYDGKERGPITVRSALQGSLNIPAVKMLYLVGIDSMVEFAQRFGYTTLSDKDRLGLSMVLGGGEIILLEHTAAYAALANDGAYNAPTFILNVKDSQGNELYAWKQQTKKVLENTVAHQITNVLADNAARAYVFGANSTLVLPGREAAAKTGTTNDYRDGWTMGYVPQLVTGVWSGNNNNAPMKSAGGSIAAGPIWNAYMRRALDKQPVIAFAKPPDNTAKKPVLRGSNGGRVVMKVDTFSGKLATDATPPELVEERTYIQAHDILHYVDKNNPQGPEPSNPSADPQYQLWETGVQDWINKMRQTSTSTISFEAPPTEFDDVHTRELQPSVSLLTPTPNTSVIVKSIGVDVRASAPRGINRVVYLVDGREVGSATSFPFALNLDLAGFANGSHTLQARAYDDIGNRGESEVVTFTINTP
jgi:membrane peptidoglycan carboxypeptidase